MRDAVSAPSFTVEGAGGLDLDAELPQLVGATLAASCVAGQRSEVVS